MNVLEFKENFGSCYSETNSTLYLREVSLLLLHYIQYLKMKNISHSPLDYAAAEKHVTNTHNV